MWKLEARPETSRAMRYSSPVIAVVLTLVCGMLVFTALGKNPIEGFRIFFLNPVRDLNAITELLLKATPLMLIAIGLAVGFRANVWNIGAEGQFLMGAVAATGIALGFQQSNSVLVLLAMVVAGALGGALWAAIPALLRTRFNANEILTSLMLVYIAQLTVSWLVFGPWKDPAGFNFPQTETFADSALLPILIEGTRLNLAFVIALAALAVGYVFMQKSYTGFKMRVAGESAAAARYAGFSATGMIWMGLCVGGAAAGVAGMAEVAGPVGQLTDKISSGYGFAAIIVAFVGRLNPVGIFFASLLMALLYIGGEQAQQYMNLPSSISKVFQGMLLFFLLGSDVFIQYRLKRTAGGGLALDNIVTSMLFATIVAGTPLIITALGELVTEKSGVLNLGAEGIMAVGAIAAFAVAHDSGSTWAGVFAGLVAGAAMSLIFAVRDAHADGEPGRFGACAVDLRRRPVGVHRQVVRVGNDVGGAADQDSATRRHTGDRTGAVRPAVARLSVVGSIRRRSCGSCTARVPASCCVLSASRRSRRTRSATR